ncbi:hypothetical protein ACQ3I4_12375 [Zafaria sp. Z1313]|uniref:hypothetical protein n=1 Tax=Zafaria sp. Z1313 TaxID=3423202 RepID=UPI003D3032BB
MSNGALAFDGTADRRVAAPVKGAKKRTGKDMPASRGAGGKRGRRAASPATAPSGPASSPGPATASGPGSSGPGSSGPQSSGPTSPGQTTPPRPARTPVPPAAAWASLTALIVAVCHVAVAAANPAEGPLPLGIIHAVPATFYVAVAASTAAVVVLLRQARELPLLLGLNTAVLAAVLHGTTPLLEGWARFPTAWLHAGYTESVMVNLDVEPQLGARFSWPGFFTAAAAVLSGSADGVPEPVLRWAPVFFQVLYLAPLLVIARRLCASWRTAWLAVALFGFANWVGQDYFAPQASAILISLTLLALVLGFLTGPPKVLRWPARLRRGSGARSTTPDAPPAAAGTREAVPAGSGPGAALAAATAPGRGPGVVPGSAKVPVGTQTAAVLLITLLAAALAASHQLTPFVLAMQLGALWMARRLRSVLLPVLVGLTALLWTSWGAIDYWISHLDDVFGQVGDPGAVFQNTVAPKPQVSEEHARVLDLRMLYVGLLGVGAFAGFARAVRAARGLDLTVPLLAAAPAALVLLQDYGGEVMLRVFLYATPFVAILLAQAFAPALRLGWKAGVAVVLAAALASPLFLVAKYGNESFERVTPEEVALGECLYRSAPAGTAILAVSPHLAWQFRDVARHYHLTVNEKSFDVTDPDGIGWQLMEADGGGYVIVSEPQIIYAQRALGAPADWGETLAAGLAADPRYTLVCSNGAGAAYRFQPESGE